MNNWDNLSIKEKQSYIRVAVLNGIRDLLSIKELYNSFAYGGLEETYYGGTLPEVAVLSLKDPYVDYYTRENNLIVPHITSTDNWLKYWANLEAGSVSRKMHEDAPKYAELLSNVNILANPLAVGEGVLGLYNIARHPLLAYKATKDTIKALVKSNKKATQIANKVRKELSPIDKEFFDMPLNDYELVVKLGMQEAKDYANSELVLLMRQKVVLDARLKGYISKYFEPHWGVSHSNRLPNINYLTKEEAKSLGIRGQIRNNGTQMDLLYGDRDPAFHEPLHLEGIGENSAELRFLDDPEYNRLAELLGKLDNIMQNSSIRDAMSIDLLNEHFTKVGNIKLLMKDLAKNYKGLRQYYKDITTKDVNTSAGDYFLEKPYEVLVSARGTGANLGIKPGLPLPENAEELENIIRHSYIENFNLYDILHYTPEQKQRYWLYLNGTVLPSSTAWLLSFPVLKKKYKAQGGSLLKPFSYSPIPSVRY